VIDEPKERNEVDHLPFDQVAEAIFKPAFVRAIVVVPVGEFLHGVDDLRVGRIFYVQSSARQVILEHVVTLLSLSQRLRMRYRFEDMLDQMLDAECVEFADAASDGVELRTMVCKELIWRPEIGEAFLQKCHRLLGIGRT